MREQVDSHLLLLLLSWYSQTRTARQLAQATLTQRRLGTDLRHDHGGDREACHDIAQQLALGVVRQPHQHRQPPPQLVHRDGRPAGLREAGARGARRACEMRAA